LDEHVRSVAWLGDSRKQVKSFPPEVRKSVGSALYDAQKGEKAPITKPFKGVGSGVFEIALRFDTDAYRTGIRTARLPEKIQAWGSNTQVGRGSDKATL